LYLTKHTENRYTEFTITNWKIPFAQQQNDQWKKLEGIQPTNTSQRYF